MVDTLAAGFGVVRRGPYLLVLPVLLDLLLRLVPPVRVGGLAWRVGDRLADWALGVGGTPEASLANLGLVGSLLRQAEEANLLAVLAWHLPTVPGRLALASGGWGPRGLADLLGLLVLLAGGAILLGALYLGLLARAAAGEGPSPALLRRVGADGLRFALYLAVAGLAYLLLLVGMGGLTLLLGLAGPFGLVLASGIFLMALFLLGLWVWLGKGPLFLEGVGPLAAFRRSGRVLARHFPSAVALYLVVSLLTLGLGLLWARLALSPLGLAPAVVANALVGTGVTASLFLFYRERASLMDEASSARV